MNIREISKPVTAKSLNESLAKRFGAKVAIEKFTLEQLQDARNRVRTQLSQVETNESFDGVHTEAYQKSKLFLDVLNAAIAEREDVSEASKPDYLDFDKDGNKKEPMKKALKDKKKKKVNELGVIDRQTGQTTLPSVNIQGDSIEDLLQQAKELALQSGDPNGQQRAREIEQIIRSLQKVQPMRTRTGESTIVEGAEDAAELVMAAKDMVDRVTGWMEDTAEMQTESMLELADAIRDEMGSEKSEAFTASVKPALEALYSAMEAARGTLTSGVGMLTGEQAPVDTMGMDDDMAMEPPVDADLGIEEPIEEPGAGGDEFGAAAPAAGGDEEAGRARRESKQFSKKKLSETSRRLSTILSKKK